MKMMHTTMHYDTEVKCSQYMVLDSPKENVRVKR